MNTVFFNFLFIQTIKRKPVWITWVLFLFVSCCFLIILPYVTSLNTLQVWANTTVSISQTMMGMVAGIFTAVLAINVFRDTRDEGTELIVISKPISRIKIVLTKFFVFGFVCLLVNISSVLLTSFTIFLPETETKYYVGLLISMFIGNAVTFAVFGAISILLSVKFARIGVIITNIVISLVFLIYQVLAAFLFSTPLKALNDNKINAYNYIVANRNTETGEYDEQEIVDFDASAPEAGKDHPCQATTWQEMQDYWEHDIKSIDPTPILNATDVASQLSLTYMSYKTNEFSQQQAQRFFGISRFYDYKLTGPASMEIIDNKKPLKWVYTREEEVLPGFFIPSDYDFPTIRPLSAAKLRGLRDKLPIGTVRSREILSMKEVYFEPNEWKNYKDGFNAMYKDILDYSHYEHENVPLQHWLWAWCWNQKNLAQYYKYVWACLTGHGEEEQYLPGTAAASYTREYYHINNPYDLNVRFMQFKNFSFWKAYEEQQESLNRVSDVSWIKEAFNNARMAEKARWDVLKEQGMDPGLKFPEGENWWMESDGLKTGLLAPNTRTLCLDLAHFVWDQVVGSHTREDIIDNLKNLFLPLYYKDSQVIGFISKSNEHYMFTSLDEPTRNDSYYGTTYFEESKWYPNVSGILKDILGINMPVGQNLILFYYQVSPKVKYWIYAAIWAIISLAAYGAGALVYNKYDVK